MKKSLLILMVAILVASALVPRASGQAPAAAPTPAPGTATSPALIPAQAKIDVFCHILPMKSKDALLSLLPKDNYWRTSLPLAPLSEMPERFKVTDAIPGYAQVLSFQAPPIELYADSRKAVELARMANDEMAALVKQYPNRFLGALGALPMNNMPEALKEAKRCIEELGFRGIQIATPINDKPLDSPEFIALYELMVKYDLPIFIHPDRSPNFSDYKTEKNSEYFIFRQFGWPFESTAAMSRLVYSGILEKYPTLKFVIHHGGAMIPYFQMRIPATIDQTGLPNVYAKLTQPPVEYFKKFYVDTAGIPAGAVSLAYSFFGADHMVFATDYPFANPKVILNNIANSGIKAEDQIKILSTNYKTLLKMP